MSTTARRPGSRGRPRVRELDVDVVTSAGELAWFAAIPSALLVLVGIVICAAPIGAALWPAPATSTFWRHLFTHREPQEHASYLIALLGPALLSGAVVVGTRYRKMRRTPATRILVPAGQLLTAGLAVTGVMAQHLVSYGPPFFASPPFRRTYFTWPTIAVAVAFAVSVGAAVRYEPLVRRLAALARETPRRRIAGTAAAILITATWMLTAFNTDGTLGLANKAVPSNFPYWLDETFSVLEGGGPLVNFHAQYGQLWAYLTAGFMSVLGTSLSVYSAVMVLGATIALVAIYTVYRRIAGSSAVALALYVPFLATGFFLERGPLENRYGPANLFSLFPMRYGGPYVLAWLIARSLDGRQPRRLALLFLAAGLIVINNPEFGVPAFGATVAALVCARPQTTWRSIRRLAGNATAGVLGAVVLVSLLTLAVAGSLPHFSFLTTFPRLYGVSGFGMLPMPVVGFHLSIYLTFVAAIVVATTRAVRGERDVLTAMLAWSGVFGLGIGSYFVGRSHPEVLIDLFSAWSFTLGLLLIVVVRAVLTRPSRRLGVAELALFAGFGLTVCSIAQTPTPWSQIARLGRHTAQPLYAHTAIERYIARNTHPGERVLILADTGHRMAYDIGIKNVSPYATFGSILTRDQLDETIAALRAVQGTKVFFSLERGEQEEYDALIAAGFLRFSIDRRVGMVELLDGQ